jgi:MFS family permease
MTTSTHSAQSIASLSEEVKLIPRWSIAAAVLAFVFMQYFAWVILPAHRTHPSTAPFSLRLYFALSGSMLAALYVLMAGYVSRDAPRRGMNTGMWVVICLAPLGGIGAVLYFLLRQPLVALCPSCSTRILTEFHFCPQCAYQVSAACGNCYRGVRITDLYCVYCGHSLASDNMPSRLRAFQS